MGKLKRVPISDAVVESQWALFAEEYNIQSDAELNSDDAMTAVLRRLVVSWKRMLRAGMIEIAEDPQEGVVVRQFLAHPVEGVGGDPPCLLYHAPTVTTIAQARIGTKSAEEMPSIQRYLKYTASATSVAEGILYQLKGGDQTRMGEIAQLFLSV